MSMTIKEAVALIREKRPGEWVSVNVEVFAFGEKKNEYQVTIMGGGGIETVKANTIENAVSAFLAGMHEEKSTTIPEDIDKVVAP